MIAPLLCDETTHRWAFPVPPLGRCACGFVRVRTIGSTLRLDWVQPEEQNN